MRRCSRSGAGRRVQGTAAAAAAQEQRVGRRASSIHKSRTAAPRWAGRRRGGHRIGRRRRREHPHDPITGTREQRQARARARCRAWSAGFDDPRRRDAPRAARRRNGRTDGLRTGSQTETGARTLASSAPARRAGPSRGGVASSRPRRCRLGWCRVSVGSVGACRGSESESGDRHGCVVGWVGGCRGLGVRPPSGQCVRRVQLRAALAGGRGDGGRVKGAAARR
ncbi:hypothetical protein C8R47DRAFT_531943 [Mycena vitilis]|nr:hypothetical protein C8R47DRAFT_531943 [Mycena vitilis]